MVKVSQILGHLKNQFLRECSEIALPLLWKPFWFLLRVSLEAFQAHLKTSISLDMFILDSQNWPQQKGPWWVARLTCWISLENFKPGGRSWVFAKFGALKLFEACKNKCTVLKVWNPINFAPVFGNNLLEFSGPQCPRAKFLRIFCKKSAKNAAKFWRFSLQIFVLQFPGKTGAARDFMKNPRHCPQCTK